MNNKIIIICDEHGKFEQKASHHIAGSGCPTCAGNNKLTTEEFISRAIKQHGDKYVYDNSVYVNMTTKIKIGCKHHGEFNQTPNEHLHNNTGCPSCSPTKKVTTEEFVYRAKKIHSNNYDYNKSTITNMNSGVIVTCNIHGDFSQRPADHLNGSGCPICSLGRRGRYSFEYFDNFPFESTKRGILYLIKVNKNWCKIGITKQKSSTDRFSNTDVIVVHEYITTLKDAYVLEQKILNKFDEERYKATDLRKQKFNGWTECFHISLLPELLVEMTNGK